MTSILKYKTHLPLLIFIIAVFILVFNPYCSNAIYSISEFEYFYIFVFLFLCLNIFIYIILYNNKQKCLSQYLFGEFILVLIVTFVLVAVAMKGNRYYSLGDLYDIDDRTMKQRSIHRDMFHYKKFNYYGKNSTLKPLNKYEIDQIIQNTRNIIPLLQSNDLNMPILIFDKEVTYNNKPKTVKF